MEKPVNPYDYYTKINLNLWSDDTNFIALVEHIQEQSPKIGNPSIRKKHLTVVLANLYYTWLDDPDKYIGYYRMTNRYKARSQYNILKISTLLIKIVDDLIELNYVDHKKGFYDQYNQSRTARMRSKKKLVTLFKKHKLKPSIIKPLPSTPCIILRNIKDDSKELVEFKSNDHVESMRKALVAYNNLLRKSYIAIPNYPKEGITKENGLKVSYNENNKFVRRVFNNGSFKDGGRFYGGFWQNIPKEWRLRIGINGWPIVEHDYSGLHIKLLYAKENIMYKEDPYELQHLIYTNYTNDELRPYLKKLLLIMLNCRNINQVLKAIRNEIQWNTELSLYSSYRHREFVDILTIKHLPIQKYLYSGYGIKLQRLDSTIAQHVIDTFTKKDIPVLCVHDSFICANAFEDELIKEMHTAYRKVSSSKEITLSYKAVDPYNYYQDVMAKNKGKEYLKTLEIYREKEWKDHYI